MKEYIVKGNITEAKENGRLVATKEEYATLNIYTIYNDDNTRIVVKFDKYRNPRGDWKEYDMADNVIKIIDIEHKEVAYKLFDGWHETKDGETWIQLVEEYTDKVLEHFAI